MKTNLFILLALIAIIPISTFAQYREVNLPSRPQQTNYKGTASEERVFWCSFETEGGTSIMESKPNMQFGNISFTGGYRFNEFLRIGAGLGARIYLNNSTVRNTNSKFGIPIYTNVRGNFISAYERDGVPFWSLNFGGITKEGLFISPTIGYSFGGLRNNFLIGLSYTLTRFENCTLTKQNYSYLSFKLGYEL